MFLNSLKSLCYSSLFRTIVYLQKTENVTKVVNYSNKANLFKQLLSIAHL